ncbi:hypothetical protein WJX77_004341 [Trebouxia sp. C0004]
MSPHDMSYHQPPSITSAPASTLASTFTSTSASIPASTLASTFTSTSDSIPAATPGSTPGCNKAPGSLVFPRIFGKGMGKPASRVILFLMPFPEEQVDRQGNPGSLTKRQASYCFVASGDSRHPATFVSARRLLAWCV